MKKYIFIILLILTSITIQAQKVTTTKEFIIKNYGDIVLMINPEDSLSMISINTVKYDNFLKLDNERDNGWYNIIGFKKYHRRYYVNSRHDLGHLTPSHITSYDNKLNRISFNYNNQAPQLFSFNRGAWKKLESLVEKQVKIKKQNVVIITGVIYLTKNYLPNSTILIPSHFYKILIFEDKKYLAWLGDNTTGKVKTTNILNIQGMNGFNFIIKWEK